MNRHPDCEGKNLKQARVLRNSGTGTFPDKPSSFYRGDVWQWGVRLSQWLPIGISYTLARTLGTIYWAGQRRRRQTVVANLLPVVDGDFRRAQQLTRQLYRQFACKLADLWRYESGLPIEHLVPELHGWDLFVAARQSRRGVLLLTPHLGNWELGAPLLASRKISLLVITLEEPDPALTQFRQRSRLRRGIETLVIGQDPFAFVEIIQKLQSGAVVALLVDRPPPPSAAQVELFGRPFLASIAPAELARATGCALIPVLVPRTGRCYRAEMLPEIAYQRSQLGSRLAREQLTQEIMRAFEPAIVQYASQWYHFVPVWHSPAAPSAPPVPGRQLQVENSFDDRSAPSCS